MPNIAHGNEKGTKIIMGSRLMPSPDSRYGVGQLRTTIGGDSMDGGFGNLVFVELAV